MSAPLFPWLEANQGLVSAGGVVVSTVAFVVALCAFLNEMRSANRAKERQIREYVDLVLGLVDPLIGMGNSAIGEANAAQRGQDIALIVNWNSTRAVALEALEAVRKTPPPQAALAIRMVHLARCLDIKPGVTAFDGGATALAYLQARVEDLSAERTKIAGLRLR